MKIAEVLSDLNSLRVCGPDEALALVNAFRTVGEPSETQSSSNTPRIGGNSTKLTDESDPDLRRAQELLILHPTVKAQHARPFNPGLESARRDIGAIIGRLKGVGGSCSIPAR
ncbi:MAG: hypothetical protein M1840_007807 [Geoglossum simile]|nr:MAG: hypothetical protein M1840_007807 [Geoglossum simile]